MHKLTTTTWPMMPRGIIEIGHPRSREHKRKTVDPALLAVHSSLDRPNHQPWSSALFDRLGARPLPGHKALGREEQAIL
ncbi:hypothetical protein L3X38_000045 [Prunus dulcis]|uniref:Uncharacterized protein n=1 Tax=Prunus dulcis TaxID=3755 RepID=A0AAD4USF9_PRUDU|nr:hypothetical protein L3X38_000045 [Prunus dulcis]